MRTFLFVVGLAVATLAAEIPKNATESSVSTPAVVVPAEAPISKSNASSSSSVNLRPEDLVKPEPEPEPSPVSTEKSPAVAVDSLFPEIHLHHEGDHPPSISAVPAPAYVVNETKEAGENLMEVSTKHTFIMKINSTTVKPHVHEGAHAEPEPTAEPEPASKGSTGAGSSTKATIKPTSLPKTSSAESLCPAVLVAVVALLVSRLC
jgi:hypothetical protein